jgi:hypothetical protein
LNKYACSNLVIFVSFAEQYAVRRYPSVKLEEHLTLVQEPGSIYIGHVAPETGLASGHQVALVECLQDEHINLESLRVIGCDGTATNTGHRSGVIRLMELHVERPFQWAICLLHFNELPLRHLFRLVDGGSSGRNTFSGPIGTAELKK